jgi:hypothetical protein
VNTRTQSFVLLLFGGALLRLATSDALLHYVRPISRPWVLLAGLAFVGLALWNLVAALRSHPCVRFERDGRPRARCHRCPSARRH